MRFRLFAARLALATLALGALVAAVCVAEVRLGLMPFQRGLSLMALAVALGAFAFVCALTWLFSALKHNEGAAKRAGMTALIGSLVLLWPPLHALYSGFTTPPIVDVTTDPENPPQFVALAKLRRPGMNPAGFDAQRRLSFQGKTGTAAYILHEFYPTLTKPTLGFIAPAKAFWRNFNNAKAMGWTIVDYSQKEGRIEAVSKSFWFGQESDIVIRVLPAGSEGARLDLRAQSASGDKDFGHNLALLKAYFRRLKG